MNTCPNCGMTKGMHGSILPSCTCPWTPQMMEILQQQRTWVGLTDEEIQVVLDDFQKYYDTMNDFARAIEAKLKEKNT